MCIISTSVEEKNHIDHMNENQKSVSAIRPTLQESETKNDHSAITANKEAALIQLQTRFISFNFVTIIIQ